MPVQRTVRGVSLEYTIDDRSNNLVVLAYSMLHTKFQGHGPIGSGEEDFFRFLPYMGMAAMLVM